MWISMNVGVDEKKKKKFCKVSYKKTNLQFTWKKKKTKTKTKTADNLCFVLLQVHVQQEFEDEHKVVFKLTDGTGPVYLSGTHREGALTFFYYSYAILYSICIICFTKIAISPTNKL